MRHCERSEAIYNIELKEIYNGIFFGEILHYGLFRSLCYLAMTIKCAKASLQGMNEVRDAAIHSLSNLKSYQRVIARSFAKTSWCAICETNFTPTCKSITE